MMDHIRLKGDPKMRRCDVCMDLSDIAKRSPQALYQ